ncbi:hypothetical protein [Agrobacterium vaccinii]|uniref:hypothetical protein n=1 Tax=Agrobacterium vaccinii TaxID=2735528 RepID=UPI001E3038BD|nr:hypothetical protein [Agrobacterium vaccinii]UHS56299.1 hypothetical protein HRS00_05480 [Agrobacterium vaccinii]
MSYDLMVFEPRDAPREKDLFLDWYAEQTQWSEGQSCDDPSGTTPNLAAWYADMRRHFPNMNGPAAYEPGHEKDNPRVTGFTIGKSVIYVDFRWSEAEAAYAAVRSLAVKHRVGFFNVSASDGEIWFPSTDHTPDRTAISGLTLTLEGQHAFMTPSIALIEAAVDWLRPAGGPGFLLLENDASEDYVQVGGGQETCSVEWREYANKGFRHWVAGRSGNDTKRDIEIPGNGTHFTVTANERLSNANVKDILGAFARGTSKPQEFVWRDITAQFAVGSSPDTPKSWWQFWR